MTFAEIHARRLAITIELDAEEAAQEQAARDAKYKAPDLRLYTPPEWLQVNPQHRDTSEVGVTYQQCGGGRRIIRKKIGGA